VLRGGSWNNNQDNARADYRNNNPLDNRNNNIGFRVVVSSHIHLRPFEYRQVPPITVGGMRWRVAGWRGCVRSARHPGVGQIQKAGAAWAEALRRLS